MEQNDLDRFEALLDTDYQERVIEAMYDWIEIVPFVAGKSRSALVENEITNPLWLWIGEAKANRKQGNYTDITAAAEFVTHAENIVYILSVSRPLYPEHIKLLSDSWGEFQREFAYHLQIHNRLQDKSHNKKMEGMQYLAEIGEKRSKQVKQWAAEGAAESVKYSNEEKQKWLDEAASIKSANQHIASARALATKVINNLHMDQSAFESVRRHLADNGFKRNG